MKRFLICILLVFCCFLCGCGTDSASSVLSGSDAETPVPSATVPGETPALHSSLYSNAVTDSTVQQHRTLSAVSVLTNLLEGDGQYLLIPCIMDTEQADEINEQISELVDTLLSEHEGAITADYSVEFDRAGLLSIVIRCYDADTSELLSLYPVTFDVITGKKYQISDFFESTAERWRNVLPDMMTEQANENGITLLSELLPIEDGQQFYLRDSELVLVYHPYEIATYEAGIPQFSIPLTELKEYFSEESPLLRLFVDTKATDVGGN